MKPLFGTIRGTIRTAAVAAAVVAISAVGAVPGARAEDARATGTAMDLYYKVFIGGFHVVDLKVDIGLDPGSYRIRTDINTSGMIGRMFPWSMEAYSHGQLDDGKVAPVAARQGNTWRGKERYIDLTFTDGVARVERIKPKADEDDRKKVPAALRTGAVDLASAIMTIIEKLDTKGQCTAQVAVFDGRRRYDLMAAPAGTDHLFASGYSPFAGPTTNCDVWIVRKAGFKDNGRSEWSAGERKAHVWMGRAFDKAPLVPARLTFQTPYGALIAYLNRATMARGTQKQALNSDD